MVKIGVFGLTGGYPSNIIDLAVSSLLFCSQYQGGLSFHVLENGFSSHISGLTFLAWWRRGGGQGGDHLIDDQLHNARKPLKRFNS